MNDQTPPQLEFPATIPIPDSTKTGDSLNQLIAQAKNDPRLDIEIKLLQNLKILIWLCGLLLLFNLDGRALISPDNKQVDFFLIHIPIDKTNLLACRHCNNS